MIQQINLYQEADSSNGPAWMLNPYLLAAVSIVLGLLAIAVMTWLSLTNMQAQRLQLHQQLQLATAEVQLLQGQLPSPQSNSLLEQQLQQSQSVFQSLSHIVEVLADDKSDQVRGFSRYLTALANQADSKVWLSRIEINATNDKLGLEGSTFQADLIPALLQRLQQTEAFKGRHFAKMQIQQTKDAPEQVDFTVSSGQPEKDEYEPRL